MSTIHDLENRIHALETSFGGIGFSIQNALTTDSLRKSRLQAKMVPVYGMQIALCVSTDDPLAAGRIKFYHGVFHSQFQEGLSNSLPQVDQLPWARPISPFGGFDDSGAPWVPPAGSKVAIVYMNGNIDDPYYLGTIWDRHRGADGQHLDYWYEYPYMDEYTNLWEGKRNGYNYGDNTGDQVFPPWNNESYRQYDWEDTQSFYEFLDQRQNTTLPHFYGQKTPNKHWLKFVDGDPYCNLKGRRIELATGRGAGLFLKDDHLTPFAQYGYSGSSSSSGDAFPCCSAGAVPTPMSPSGGPCPVDCAITDIKPSEKGMNPYQERREENKYYTGVNTPQANKVDLKQSGACLISPGGNRLTFDDSVDQPTGIPDWSLDFDFGCNDKYKGKIELSEATGHVFTMDGSEEFSKVRGENNGIRLSTAFGNFAKFNDHIEGEESDCPPGSGGENRGIDMGTTSGHRLVMNDKGLRVCGEPRKYDPKVEPADESGYEGFCMFRSGYGLQLLFKDDSIQTETENQFILLEAPQKTNFDKGPHQVLMQEQAEGPGYLFLRAGGVMHMHSTDEMLEVVGEEENPASKFSSITDSYIVQAKNYYFNHNNLTLLWADTSMYLIAGLDCEITDNPAEIQAEVNAAIAASQQFPGQAIQESPRKFPCIYDVITSKDPWTCPLTGYVHFGVLPDQLDSRSQRVFVSAKKEPDPDAESV